MQKKPMIFTGILIVLMLTCGCSSSAPQQNPAAAAGTPGSAAQMTAAPQDSQMAPATFTISVASVQSGGTIPREYTCTGASESPAVSWSGVPADAKSLALIVDDQDAPAGTFTHWIVYNIPPKAGGIPAAQTAQKELESGGQQGTNSADSRGYYPVCQPVGANHRYRFTLYAVDYQISMPTADREGIDWALNGHVIKKTELVATFKR